MKRAGHDRVARPDTRPRCCLTGAAVLVAALVLSGSATAQCRQALVLGLDISGSVDDREYRLQLDGLAGALASTAVRDALMAMPGAPVDLAVFEWSGPEGQRIILPWTTLNDSAAVDRVIVRLTGTRRHKGDPSTALGAAMAFGAGVLGQRPGCWRQVLDLSGDGISNTGPRPQIVRDGLAPRNMVINGLVVSEDKSDRRQGGTEALSDYFRANVIRGAEAFVEVALGYEDYRAAMERKLLRELQVVTVGDLP